MQKLLLLSLLSFTAYAADQEKDEAALAKANQIAPHESSLVAVTKSVERVHQYAEPFDFVSNYALYWDGEHDNTYNLKKLDPSCEWCTWSAKDTPASKYKPWSVEFLRQEVGGIKYMIRFSREGNALVAEEREVCKKTSIVMNKKALEIIYKQLPCVKRSED